jgi:hypothetical protein
MSALSWGSMLQSLPQSLKYGTPRAETWLIRPLTIGPCHTATDAMRSEKRKHAATERGIRRLCGKNSSLLRTFQPSVDAMVVDDITEPSKVTECGMNEELRVPRETSISCVLHRYSMGRRRRCGSIWPVYYTIGYNTVVVVKS